MNSVKLVPGVIKAEKHEVQFMPPQVGENNNCGQGDNFEIKPNLQQNQPLDIRTWLSNIEPRLAEYARLFERHSIDEKTLPLVTYIDLGVMGIEAIGDKRRIHEEIKKLRKSSV